MASVLQSASRESLAAATARLDAHIDENGASDLTRLSDDLFAVLSLLEREHALRRALADSATPAESRTGLADRLLSGKVGRPALDETPSGNDVKHQGEGAKKFRGEQDRR